VEHKIFIAVIVLMLLVSQMYINTHLDTTLISPVKAKNQYTQTAVT